MPNYFGGAGGVKVDNETLEEVGGVLRVKDGGITLIKLKGVNYTGASTDGLNFSYKLHFNENLLYNKHSLEGITEITDGNNTTYYQTNAEGFQTKIIATYDLGEIKQIKRYYIKAYFNYTDGTSNCDFSIQYSNDNSNYIDLKSFTINDGQSTTKEIYATANINARYFRITAFPGNSGSESKNVIRIYEFAVWEY